MSLLTSVLREAFQNGSDFLSLFYRRIESEGALFLKADGFNADLTSGIDVNLPANETAF